MEGNDSTAMTPALFEAQIAALAQAGYTAVFPDDLAAYVNQGKALPDKPIVITFDDGMDDGRTSHYSCGKWLRLWSREKNRSENPPLGNKTALNEIG